DSYNVNGLGQLAALKTLDHLAYYRANFREIMNTRNWLSEELRARGFDVFPSQTNFILTQPPSNSAKLWQNRLRTKEILVRWFDQDEIWDYLRITIGTPKQAEALVEAIDALL